MSTLARYLRARAADDVRRMTPDERILIALRLGDEDLTMYCTAQGIDTAEGQLRLRAQRQRGRRASASVAP